MGFNHRAGIRGQRPKSKMAALNSKASFLQGLPRPVIIMMTVKTLLKPTTNKPVGDMVRYPTVLYLFSFKLQTASIIVRLAVDMDIHGYIHEYIHGYIHVWI